MATYREKRRVIITDDLGRKITRELPVPGTMNYVQGAFQDVYPGYTGPLNVDKLDGSGNIVDSVTMVYLGELTEKEFADLITKRQYPYRN